MMEELNSFITSGKWFNILDLSRDGLHYRAKILRHKCDYLEEETKDYYVCALEALNRENTSMGNAFFDVFEGDKTSLSSIFVQDDYRGQGIGSGILGAVEYLSSMLGAKYIEGRFHARTDYADVFYAKNGYTILGKAPAAKINKVLDKSQTYDSYVFGERAQVCDSKQQPDIEQ